MRSRLVTFEGPCGGFSFFFGIIRGMSWTSRRQALYLFAFAGLLALFVGVPVFFYLYNPPSCTDGVQNGTEEGVDCGGGCPIICSFEAADPIVSWSRSFEVVPGLYSVVALVENPNFGFETDAVPYAFRLRDSQGVLVYEHKGSAYFPARSLVPVFGTGLRTGERVPARVEFEFLREPVWTEASEWKSGIGIVSRSLSNEDTSPRVTAVLRNTTLSDITNIPVVALLYDAQGNAVHASRTVVDVLAASSDRTIVFTWLAPFSRPVARIDIVPVPTLSN